ncbi:MoaD/ThiS family protein [Thermanaerosceptrum fracticalcis]|uniref:MoaD/ThiS family protein n=1 Tax=Thermanaerosceptrum fracticalcis TaxID=1712410 RepID=A0A7G6E1Y2_THEFR|nr:MoaD/ThiS family protein [Thermanaerosceptrum fracticalcis]
MQVEVRLYAYLRDTIPEAKKGPLLVDIPEDSTIGDLLAYLQLPDESNLIVMVDGIRQFNSYPLKNGSRIAIFPPIGGG